jgi:nitrile hydratase accessory protein
MSESEPVFAEPWQAHAFALAVKLSETGHFTWSEWSAALAAEVAAASRRGESDDGSHYYDHWLSALERLVAAKQLASPRSLAGAKRGVGHSLSKDTAWQPDHAGCGDR